MDLDCTDRLRVIDGYKMCFYFMSSEKFRQGFIITNWGKPWCAENIKITLINFDRVESVYARA